MNSCSFDFCVWLALAYVDNAATIAAVLCSWRGMAAYAYQAWHNWASSHADAAARGLVSWRPRTVEDLHTALRNASCSSIHPILRERFFLYAVLSRVPFGTAYLNNAGDVGMSAVIKKSYALWHIDKSLRNEWMPGDVNIYVSARTWVSPVIARCMIRLWREVGLKMVLEVLNPKVRRMCNVFIVLSPMRAEHHGQ